MVCSGCSTPFFVLVDKEQIMKIIEVPWVDKEPYEVTVYMFNLPDELIDFVERKGGEQWLEDNKVFVGCVLTVPPHHLNSQLDDKYDYYKVLNKYPKSNRVYGNMFYLGNIPREHRRESLESWLLTGVMKGTSLNLVWEDKL